MQSKFINNKINSSVKMQRGSYLPVLVNNIYNFIAVFLYFSLAESSYTFELFRGSWHQLDNFYQFIILKYIICLDVFGFALFVTVLFKRLV